MSKAPEAFRTISEVSELLDTPAHVLRFWESRFSQIKPVKRAGGRRYYRPADVALLGGIKKLLHDDGITIRGVQKLLREQGVHHVASQSSGAVSEKTHDRDAVIEAQAIAVAPLEMVLPEQAETYEASPQATEPVSQESVETAIPSAHTTKSVSHEPVAVTGFALESFVAKHGGHGLPLPDYETAGKDAGPSAISGDEAGIAYDPPPDALDTTEILRAQTDERVDDSGDFIPVDETASDAPDEQPSAMPLPPVGVDRDSASGNDPDAPPGPAESIVFTPDMRTPEDAVAMVDAASLYRTASALRRADPAVFANDDGQIAALYERMRALRLRLAQDVGIGRR